MYFSSVGGHFKSLKWPPTLEKGGHQSLTPEVIEVCLCFVYAGGERSREVEECHSAAGGSDSAPESHLSVCFIILFHTSLTLNVFFECFCFGLNLWNKNTFYKFLSSVHNVFVKYSFLSVIYEKCFICLPFKYFWWLTVQLALWTYISMSALAVLDLTGFLFCCLFGHINKKIYFI